MACTTFHPFPHLPYDIRLLIWKAAIRPQGPDAVGIHNVSTVCSYRANETRTILPPLIKTSEICHIVAIPEFDPYCTANRSAYLWDSGLWTACSESRHIIAKSFNMVFGYEKRHPPIHDYDGTDFACGFMGGDLLKHTHKLPTLIPALSLPNDTGEGSQYLVRPDQDAFKLRPETMLFWTKEFRMLPDWWDNYFYFPCAIPKTYTSVKNLILEFDSSWNDDWPEDLSTLMREISPRGFVSLFLMASDCFDVDIFIWLIDRGDWKHNEPCFPSHRGTEPRVFYDYDEEYLPLHVTCALRARHNVNNSALHFINQLDDLYSNRPCPCKWSVGHQDGNKCESQILTNLSILRPGKKVQISPLS